MKRPVIGRKAGVIFKASEMLATLKDSTEHFDKLLALDLKLVIAKAVFEAIEKREAAVFSDLARAIDAVKNQRIDKRTERARLAAAIELYLEEHDYAAPVRSEYKGLSPDELRERFNQKRPGELFELGADFEQWLFENHPKFASSINPGGKEIRKLTRRLDIEKEAYPFDIQD